MIRIVAIMDKARTLYADDDVALLTGDGSESMTPIGRIAAEVYGGGNVVGDEATWNLPTRRARLQRYVVTDDPAFDTGDERVRVCVDPTELIERFATSNDELVVVGGAALFKTFTPVASQVDVLELHDELPDGATFVGWAKGDFELVQRTEQANFDLVSYRRRLPISLDGWYAD